jgi:hypothetical protein
MTTRTQTATAQGGHSGHIAGREDFDAYLEAMKEAGMPVLGYTVWFTITDDAAVTRQQLETWFLELGLHPGLLPGPPRAVDAFEKTTGETKLTYPLDGRPPRIKGQRQPRRRVGELQREATLFVAHVARDAKHGWIERHLVRKVRDEENLKLEYKTKLAWCVFQKDKASTAEAGAGAMQIRRDDAAIAALDPAERAHVEEMIAELEAQFDRRCRYITGNRLRTMVREIMDKLNTVLLKPSGGVYFVPRQHADTVHALHTLVARFGGDSSFDLLPVPELDRMRTVIGSAFTRQAKAELDKLAADLAAALQAETVDKNVINALTSRFQDVQKATAEHAELLGTTLSETEASLQTVNIQLVSLLSKPAPDDDAEDADLDEEPTVTPSA